MTSPLGQKTKGVIQLGGLIGMGLGKGVKELLSDLGV
jgi:hypothetical protein